ncbi:hypothetical protein ACRALDRAFT_1065279 [Sodiomyces alcalophilus JCM 7366]|uniref:uncharacterized protein n=1 Tax=Sodiomyces alcalophilus JCM 7366 TaxID=591952 RepID=UPI0039B4AC1F
MVLWRRKEEPDAYPAVPDSLRTDSIELDGARKTRQARADTAPSVTPYLSLRARLSQIWLNRWTLLLLLVLLRVLLMMVDLDENVDDANREAVSACTKVEDVGSAMASMPHYLSVGVNELSAQGIEASVDALVAVLDLMITGVQGLIIFIINMVTAMYTCLITAFIHGSLDVAADVTEKVTNAINRTIQGITNSLESRVDRIEDGIGSVMDAIEDSFIGGVFPDFPDIDFSGPISDLRDIKVNTDSFVDDINRLNDDLPTFEEVQDATAGAIAIPFRLLRQTIHDALDDYRFDRSVFPVASKQALRFCSENNTISEFFDQLRDMIRAARTAFIAGLVALAVLAMAPMAWLEIRRWRREKEHARIVGDRSYDPMDVVYIASRPLTAAWGIKMSSRFQGRRQVLVRWAWAYATSLPALFVLALGLAGLLACLCQYIMLRAIQDQVPKLADHVGEFADEVVTSLQAVSREWADDANGVVASTQSTINDDLLGWVREATSTVNDTLTTFTDMMTLGLETVFNGTILKGPIETVIYCTIGLRIESIQSGMTWVHDHAKIALPRFPNDMFSNGAQDSIGGDSDTTTFLATPSSVTTDEVTGAVQRVADRLRAHIIQELLISTGILMLYVIIVLIGLVRALLGMATPDKGRGEGGMRYASSGDDGPHATPAGSHGADHRFAAFGDGSHARAVHDDHYARDMNDEKTVAAVSGGHPREVYPPQRTSSYGQLESAHSKH